MPDPGANNLYVSDALAILTLDWEKEDGEEFIRKNACGDLCVNYKDKDRYKRPTFAIEMCQPDPQLLELLTGGTVLTSGAAVGYAYPAIGVDPVPNGVSMEIWAKRVMTDGSLDSDHPYAWWVFPRVYLFHGAKNFENAPQNTELSGYGTENENWFDGPLDDWPVDSGSAAQWIPTASIPTASCGYQTTPVS